MSRLSRAHLERLRERALRSLMRSGWAGAVGVALLAFALAFGLSSAELRAQRAEALAAERAMLLKVAAAPAQAPLSPRGQLEAFYDGFPPGARLSEALAAIHLSAQRAGLLPERGDYRAALVAGTPLVRITATLPVAGRFDTLYGWLGEVVRGNPGVGIEQLSIKRDAPHDVRVQADVRLNVYVRGGQ
jgi:hypothetical protein